MAFRPAEATSEAEASETNSLAIFWTSGSSASGGTRLCVAWARQARNVVTEGWRGVRYLVKYEYKEISKISNKRKDMVVTGSYKIAKGVGQAAV